MIIVSDTSPLCYLVLIGYTEVLPSLYGIVHTTRTVVEELLDPDAPSSLRRWALTPPAWLHVHPDPPAMGPSWAALDPGERTALGLAEQLRSDVLLVDEAAARALATRLGLRVSGTLGVLCQASQAGLLSLPPALDLLRRTNFRASPQLWKSLYDR